jgi:hypothetical protein
MASEILAVPEDDLREVIGIIRAGLKATKKVSKDVKDNLTEWCNEEEEYLGRLSDDE